MMLEDMRNQEINVVQDKDKISQKTNTDSHNEDIEMMYDEDYNENEESKMMDTSVNYKTPVNKFKRVPVLLPKEMTRSDLESFITNPLLLLQKERKKTSK